MFNPTRGSARQLLPAREQLQREDLERLLTTGTLITDDRRRRPLYFDGRFLAARDLTREQTYFLARQADLGRAGGAGVVYGLLVEAGPTATSIRIQAGHGVTPSGELAVLPNTLTVELADMAEIQRLDAAFGLLQIPREPARNRSGLFIVALRPVEFTANPIASYPTTINGPRSVEDGDIIEGVVATLIPFPDEGARNELDMRRARVAQKIFAHGGKRGIPAEALPLAMIALDRGVVRWIDSFMVRREVGAERGFTLGLGLAPRALREAHLLQYQQHLREVLEQRRNGNRGQRFAATDYFLALPPAGRLPAAAIDRADFTQIFFPPEVEVDLSIIPDDEVSVLLEESLLLPPIDLTSSGEELESTSVLVLLSLPRQEVRTLNNRLSTLTRTLKPSAPGLVAKRKPLESLAGFALARLGGNTTTAVAAANGSAADSLANTAWTEALSRVGDGLLWYVRRRNLQSKAEVIGTGILAQVGGTTQPAPIPQPDAPPRPDEVPPAERQEPEAPPKTETPSESEPTREPETETETPREETETPREPTKPVDTTRPGTVTDVFETPTEPTKPVGTIDIGDIFRPEITQPALPKPGTPVESFDDIIRVPTSPERDITLEPSKPGTLVEAGEVIKPVGETDSGAVIKTDETRIGTISDADRIIRTDETRLVPTETSVDTTRDVSGPVVVLEGSVKESGATIQPGTIVDRTSVTQPDRSTLDSGISIQPGTTIGSGLIAQPAPTIGGRILGRPTSAQPGTSGGRTAGRRKTAARQKSEREAAGVPQAVAEEAGPTTKRRSRKMKKTSGTEEASDETTKSPRKSSAKRKSTRKQKDNEQ